MKAVSACLALLLVLAAGQAPAPGPAVLRESATAHDGCFHVCKHARGLGASDCMTECRAYTDVAPDKSEALKEFVADNSYNEAGGEHMEEAYEEMHPGEKVPDCKPTFTGSPKFEDIDLDGDGVITPGEAERFGEKMCVSNEMVMQIFDMTDRNLDKVVDAKEYNQVGEDTKAENAIDKAIDPLSEGDDEYAEAKLPQFEEFDENKDGELDDNELEKVMMFELHRRFPGVSDDELVTKAADVMDELAALVHHLDKDGDGKVSRKEFHMKHDKEDLGDEFKEAAEGDHNEKEIDDEKSAEHPTMVPPPADNLPAAPGPAASPAPAAAAMMFRDAPARAWWAGGEARQLRLRQPHHTRRPHRAPAKKTTRHQVHRDEHHRAHRVHLATAPTEKVGAPHLPSWMRTVLARRQQQHRQRHRVTSLASLHRLQRAHHNSFIQA